VEWLHVIIIIFFLPSVSMIPRDFGLVILIIIIVLM